MTSDKMTSDKMTSDKMSGVTRLKSATGDMYVVLNSALERSETLKSMLHCTSQGLEEEEVVLDRIPSCYLENIVDWLNEDTKPCDLSVMELFRLIVHVNYLSIPELLKWCCEAVVERLISEKGDGRFNVIADPTCFNSSCSELSRDKLLRCGGCKITKYCSRKCQAQDWTSHKVSCKEISHQNTKMHAAAKTLQEDIYPDREDMFGSDVGHFWGAHETRPYCRARLWLAEGLLELADKSRQCHVYEAALAHYLELMRLNRSDNMGNRERTPFILLKLNRDDDCYNFLKWWVTVDDGTPYTFPSKEADWLYLTEENKFEDIFEYTNGKESLAFLVAFLCLKLRLYASCRAQVKAEHRIMKASKAKGLAPLSDVMPSMKDIIYGNANAELKERKQIRDIQEYNCDILLMFHISRHNEMFLPAILNPEPLLKNSKPQLQACGSAEEAYQVVKDSKDILLKIPGAMSKIREFVGHDTEYDPTFKIAPIRNHEGLKRDIVRMVWTKGVHF